MFKKVRPALSCPEQSRREGRSPFDAWSAHVVREREGRQKGENAAGLSACGTHRQAAFFNIPKRVE